MIDMRRALVLLAALLAAAGFKLGEQLQTTALGDTLNSSASLPEVVTFGKDFL